MYIIGHKAHIAPSHRIISQPGALYSGSNADHVELYLPNYLPLLTTSEELGSSGMTIIEEQTSPGGNREEKAQ